MPPLMGLAHRHITASRPNAGRQLLPEAGATQERTLEAVSSRPLFGPESRMAMAALLISSATARRSSPSPRAAPIPVRLASMYVQATYVPPRNGSAPLASADDDEDSYAARG
jgi:hypothetical protein